MTTEHTITLARLHKVAERARTRIGELQSGFERKSSSTVLRAPLNKELDNLKSDVRLGDQYLYQADTLCRELATVRGVIARENARLGLHELLARQDLLTRQLGSIRNVLQNAELVRLPISSVLPGADLGEAGRAVSPLDWQEIEGLREQAEALQAEIYALSDQVAEANATRITVELSPMFAKFLPGASHG
ncbi:hypothetical protein ACOTHJ_13180 [Achromobacter xylosoxidans]|uniref:hypothetical protein n=1 Tax=Achromobacter anxifer TaxID=1287737 RepID=UPI00155C8F28|nr:hypothetical protein [Achromobacter anxifer]CAB5514645.1 hypothetical protein LMG26857_03704 [Achromobacter anxifer]